MLYIYVAPNGLNAVEKGSGRGGVNYGNNCEQGRCYDDKHVKVVAEYEEGVAQYEEDWISSIASQ